MACTSETAPNFSPSLPGFCQGAQSVRLEVKIRVHIVWSMPKRYIVQPYLHVVNALAYLFTLWHHK